LALLLVLGVTVTVEAAVTHPLRELAEAARGLSRRQFDTRLPKTSGDEVGSLVESFAAMREDLRAYQQSLETEIAEHQRAERALQELNATLESRVREEVESNRKKDHLLIQQSRSAAMGELAHNIAHQWRQPLNKIALLATNLGDDYADGALTPELLRQYQAKFGGIVRGLSETIDDFRNFFAPEEAAQSFDLAEAVRHALAIVEDGFRDAGIALSVELPENLTGHGFPHEFSQAVLNLLNNGKEAILANQIRPGEIRVFLAREGDFAVLRVADNGGGIPAEVLPKVFDPYFTTKDTGAGIGLYMVKMVMESMKGSARAANGEKGAEFVLRLPVHPPVQ
jgi:signal transduction histidine kinase